jgi:hypothetical protein
MRPGGILVSGGKQLHPTLPARLAARLAAEARAIARSLGDPSVKTAQVYGPDSRYALVKASSGDLVERIARERKGFYLIVLHGHFVCHGCSRPSGSKARLPRGKIATEVWAPKAGQTDFGVGNRPVSMSHLRGPTVITLGRGDGKQHSAYAYELPIDPSHPERGQWSTLVRTNPVTVGYRVRGIFPREWIVASVKPLPQDGQQAAVRGWRGRNNPIWQGRLVLRPPSLLCPSHAPPAASLEVAGPPLVRRGAVQVKLCRYSGGNAPRPLELARSRLIRSVALIGRLTQELNTLPQARRGTYHCPSDDGSEVLLRFGYRTQTPRGVIVGLTGCHFVTNGLTDRSGPSPESARLVKQLTSLTGR